MRWTAHVAAQPFQLIAAVFANRNIRMHAESRKIDAERRPIEKHHKVYSGGHAIFLAMTVAQDDRLAGAMARHGER